MPKRVFDVEVITTVRVNVDEDTPDEFGSPWNPARMDDIYESIRTPNDMLEHWAYNAVANGITNARRLDGWARDDGDGPVRMRVMEVRADCAFEWLEHADEPLPLFEPQPREEF